MEAERDALGVILGKLNDIVEDMRTRNRSVRALCGDGWRTDQRYLDQFAAFDSVMAARDAVASLLSRVELSLPTDVDG